jgi:hypothetical protein
LETKWVLSEFLNIVDWSGCSRLLRESGSKGDPTGAKRAEGGPPAESECPERKSTFRFTLPQKNVENIEFIYSMKPL